MWNLTIAGAIICILYGWIITVVYQYKKIQYKKQIRLFGTGLCGIGIMVLASFALTLTNTEFNMSRTAQGYFKTQPNNMDKIQDNIAQARAELGPRPTDKHIAHEDKHGELIWVTQEEYIKLKQKGD